MKRFKYNNIVDRISNMLDCTIRLNFIVYKWGWISFVGVFFLFYFPFFNVRTIFLYPCLK